MQIVNLPRDHRPQTLTTDRHKQCVQSKRTSKLKIKQPVKHFFATVLLLDTQTQARDKRLHI